MQPKTLSTHAYQPSHQALSQPQTQAHSNHLTQYPTTAQLLHRPIQPSAMMYGTHHALSSSQEVSIYRLGRSPTAPQQKDQPTKRSASS